jgi:DNA invertase Pin-like site-specific DNA recombinase
VAFLSAVPGYGGDLFLRQQGVDTTTPGGKALFQMMGVFGEFERAMLERQREGIAKAKAEGKFKGRAPAARRKAGEVKAMAAAGTTRQVIDGKLGMSERSVYRVLGQSL